MKSCIRNAWDILPFPFRPVPAEEDSSLEKVHGFCYDQGTEMTAGRNSSWGKVCNEGREAQWENNRI